MFYRRFSLAYIAFFILLQPCAPVGADDTQLRQKLTQLVTGEKEARAEALETLAATKDGRIAGFLEAFQLGQVYLLDNRLVICQKFQTDADGNSVGRLLDPLTLQPLLSDQKPLVVTKSKLTSKGPARRDRKGILSASRVLSLYVTDVIKRKAAYKKLGDMRVVSVLAQLRDQAEKEKDPKARRTAKESIALILLGGFSPDITEEDRLLASKTLQDMCSARAVPLLKETIKKYSEADDPDTQAIAAFQVSLAEIERYQGRIRLLSYIFSGLSLGSILILMALGLSIIFGQMGVINMAHGELMMIGAYATYEMQRLFGHSMPENPVNMFFVFAIPVAFFAAALVGWLIERLLVRHLYNRPLETLLATWGAGLILIQIVRLRYGDNIGVNSPTWFVGSWELIQDFNLPYNRLFIIALTTCCVVMVYWITNYTKQGLLIRATVQNRETAASLGVNTRWSDGFTFALGAGLAGVAGCALTLIGGVTPDMGNWRDPNDHSKGFVNVGCGKAEYVCSHDEDHSFPGYKKMIFGPDNTVGAKAPYPNATMDGYANHSEPSWICSRTTSA